MAYTYTLTSGSSVLRSDGAIIPSDPLNLDWLDYLIWLAVPNTPAPAPTSTANQTAAQVILSSGSITLHSTLTPALNSVYPIDYFNFFLMCDFYLVSNATVSTPSGSSTFNWYDSAGVAHSFTLANFAAFTKAVMQYYYAVMGIAITGSGSFPSTTLNIL